MFSYLNKRLEKTAVNYDIIFHNYFKRLRNGLLLSTLLQVISIAGYFYTKEKYTLIIAIILIPYSLRNLYALIKALRLVPCEDKASLIVVQEILSIKVMKRLLRKESGTLTMDDLQDVNVNDIEGFEAVSIRNYLIKYKVVPQIILLIALATLLTVFVPLNLYVYNVIITNVVKFVLSVLALISLHNIINALGISTDKLYYKGISNRLFRYYSKGIISGEQYKYCILYYSDLLNEGLFGYDEYDYFTENELVSGYDVVVSYIQYTNKLKFKGLISLAVLISIGLYFVDPLYSLVGLAPLLLSLIFLKVNDKENNLIKYEDKVMNNSPKLTSILMQELPKSFVENL